MTALEGAAAGLAATVPMTAFMEASWTQLPAKEQYALPPREVTGQVGRAVGVWDEMSEAARATSSMAAHFAYGAAAGAIYGAAVPETSRNALTGMAFGIGLWTASYLGLMPALGILRPATEHPPRRNALMIAAHVVWGGTLGTLMDRKSR